VVDVPTHKFEPPAPPPQQPSQQERVHAEARKKVFRDAVAADTIRHNWTKEEISAIYYQPLLELAFQAVSRPQRALLLPVSSGRHISNMFIFNRATSTENFTSPAKYNYARS
jgi:hypothetical protein